jgi:PqqD family protein of HPr-rel-A system
MAGALYIADPESAVATVALDGLSVLFHAPSGTTHILAAPAPEILGVLRDGPADLDEIFRRLSESYALEPLPLMGSGWGGVDSEPRAVPADMPPPPRPSPIKGEGAFAQALAARLDELEAAGLVRRA